VEAKACHPRPVRRTLKCVFDIMVAEHQRLGITRPRQGLQRL
jgi:hypothetical protein